MYTANSTDRISYTTIKSTYETENKNLTLFALPACPEFFVNSINLSKILVLFVFPITFFDILLVPMYVFLS